MDCSSWSLRSGTTTTSTRAAKQHEINSATKNIGQPNRSTQINKITASCLKVLVVLVAIHLIQLSSHITKHDQRSPKTFLARAHVVLTRDDHSNSLVLTGEDGKGEESGGGQLVIAGNNMGGGSGGQDSRMVMQNAAEREGDIVMNGKSMIIPGEDGHIVLADGRSQDDGGGREPPRPLPNPMMFWLPYMRPRMTSYYGGMMPFFGR